MTARPHPQAATPRIGVRIAIGIAIATAMGAATSPSPAQDDVAGAPPDAWRDAEPGYRFDFPRDHGAHPDFRIEWWYWTGNLESESGQRFGFQLTFFRSGVDRSPPGHSRWEVRDLHLAHFALSDVDGGRHLTSERLHRAGIGRAGATTADLVDQDNATARPIRVWNGEWSAEFDPDSGEQSLRARDPAQGFGIELELAPAAGRPPSFNGEAGFSRKGATPGNASLYYSMTRLRTTGTVEVGGESFRVTGASWLDREFGSSFLEPGQAGWDWFALQLDDGRDLMVYRLRRDDGSADPFSAGTLTGPDGTTRHLTLADFKLTPQRTWLSPETGAGYPVAWSVEVPSEGIALEVEALFDAQEFRSGTGIDYWEGAVDASGSHPGRGYLELAGYSGATLTRALR